MKCQPDAAWMEQVFGVAKGVSGRAGRSAQEAREHRTRRAQEFQALREQGLTFEGVAARCGVSTSFVQQEIGWLLQAVYGLELETKTRGERRETRLARAREFLVLRRQGMSYRAIARRYLLNENSVAAEIRWLVRAEQETAK